MYEREMKAKYSKEYEHLNFDVTIEQNSMKQLNKNKKNRNKKKNYKKKKKKKISK